MEGSLLIPPDRGTIIGRAIWKTRYVVIGPLRDVNQPNTSLSQVLSSTRIKDVGPWASKPQLQRLQPDGVYLTIYKTKDDCEPVQQHSIASVTDCSVQMVAHRKQGPVLPTLAVQISPDPATDKLRKRRSSRTAGLTSSKESGPVTLWFRTGEDNTHSLGDWARFIQSLARQPEVPGRHHPLSPVSPTSPTFTNPFASSHSQDMPEYFSTSSSMTSKRKTKLQPKSSGQAYAPSRDPLSSYHSESPSLRSRRSDLSSSHASSMNPNMGFIQQYTTVHPSDLPSPATTIGEYNDQFIEGWTSAQGRSSTLSSPIRGRGSIGSSHGQGPQPSIHSSSPPAPRETILDRAFQLRCIPGSDREIPGEEKLSSIARFEALMRDAEERRRTMEKEKEKEREMKASQAAPSTWEEEDDGEEEEEGERNAIREEPEDDDDDTDEDGFEDDVDHDHIGPSAFAALHFITNGHTTNRHSGKWPNTANRSSLNYEGGPSILRPHTAHSRLRPAAQRTSSQPQIPVSSVSASTSITAAPNPPLAENNARRSHEKRHSTSGVNHLSFNEFTKRLSSTSSLLLVQTNTSTGSSRGSSHNSTEIMDGGGALQTTPRGALSPRTAGAASGLTPAEREERCRWRGSVGVFGSADGGFL
ncbi:hypothetical protein F4778DRAFT_791449 [Xylariomycetidae sp. FL2044]|nr:hypothetical protein F4778DRAFT_791449 [Xylariomycetidae sp. FL2044]